MIKKNKRSVSVDNLKAKSRILLKFGIDKYCPKALIALTIISVCVVASFAGVYIYERFFKSTTIKPGYTISTVNVNENSAITTTAKKVMPAVVSITGVAHAQSLLGETSSSEVAGTGYIVRSDGLIVTNKHVVSSISAVYTVITNDGKSYPATVKSTDPMFDIAIMKIDAIGLPTVELSATDNLTVGQTAIAIGNALGQYQNSVTVGVISGIGRVIEASDSMGTSTESLENVIQTDAAINSGNSGGPLLNISGQVVGMNTAVDATGQGIGFALPGGLIKSALNSYITNGKITRAMLGVRYISLTKKIAIENNLSIAQGAYIYSASSDQPAVISASPADKVGLLSGDIITEIGSEKITEQKSLITLLSMYNPNDTVEITWIHAGKVKTAIARLVESQN